MATGSDPTDPTDPEDPEDPANPEESTEPEEPDDEAIDELLRDIEAFDLREIDFDALRVAELEQTQWILEDLSGKTITKAYIDDRRIVIETDDGNRYFFYGFMGSGPPR